MIKVHKIQADNIRSLGHVVFTPLADGGMTAVNGPNGSGKSSLLAALVWAVYGVTPDGVPQTAMRRQGSTGECKVIVDFEHDGQIITVERGLKGRNDSTYMKVSVNGIEQSFGKIRACEAWLTNRLGGLDAEGFLTAFVVRQKELDGLVKAKPAERRKLIERLAGIDRMSTAVKTAREEETDVKKRIELLPGDPEAVKAARAEVEEAQTTAARLWEDYEQAKADAATAAESYTTATAAAQTMQARVEAAATAAERLTAARHARDLAAERAQAAQRELARLTESAVGGTPAEVTAAQTAHESAQTALAENQRAREVADRAIADANRAAEAARQANTRAQSARAEADNAAAQAETARQRAAGFPATLEADAEQAARAEADATERVGALRGEHERLAASIKAMEATDAGDSCCPTCATRLADPSQVLATLREARDRVLTDGRAAAEQAKTLGQQAQSLRTQAQAAAQAAAEATHLSQRAADFAAAAVEADRVAAEANQTAAEAAADAEAAKQAARSAAEQTAALQARVSRTAEALRDAQVASAAASQIPAASTAAARADAALGSAEQALAVASDDEAAARVPAEEQNSVFETYRTAQARAAETDRATAEAHGNFRVAEEQVKAAERHRDAEEMKLRARAEAFEELEVRTAVREALDDFRKDRIASLAPELSEIATDSIARMTDGKFVAVELDEEFTPIVTDANGMQRPASWLSGGEESAVALALRLAIGEVIAGQQGGLLWMDEPQTAMDAQRRPAMMSVIRDLPGRQPIIISHVTEATDMVDHVVEVIPDEENGSTLIDSADLSAVDASTLAALDAV